MNNLTETIASVCTPPGNSRSGIIRISGPDSFKIVNAVFQEHNQSSCNLRSCVKGQLDVIFNLSGGVFKTNTAATVYYMPGPASYTCEDVAEIVLTGSQPILNAALRSICAAGCRHAGAGEFTLRAFINGRIDLTQAEAVERIIDAETESDRRQALSRIDGHSSASLARWRQELLEISGTVEAVLDFAEEDIDEDLEYDLAQKLALLSGECHQLTQKCSRHRPEDNGIRVTFAGLTNAGKSSVLNALIGEEKALVSSERSTTRDRLVYNLEIERFRFSLEDCPGIDCASNIIAAAASNHAKDQYAASALLLLVADSSQAVSVDFYDFINQLPPCRILLVFNKLDIARDEVIPALRNIVKNRPGLILAGECQVSALSGSGIIELKRLLYDEALGDMSLGGGVLTRREAMEIEAAADHCLKACHLLEDGLELAAIELRLAYEAFSRASGEGYAEDILENVFSRFCIGK